MIALAIAAVGLAAVLVLWDLGRRSIARADSNRFDRVMTLHEKHAGVIEGLQSSRDGLASRLEALEADFEVIRKEAREIRLAKGLGKR